ncbi:MAG: hypothetical protein AMJ65_02765 [Phycisphaerae bacterium SG8_4]|nr:MAG: hypothetical protein AMJ65_02765 [Phycisphaerae bacterium SG8_4]
MHTKDVLTARTGCFLLICPPISGIILTMKLKQETGWYDFQGGAMAKFYNEIWLPFVFNKKRILFLAIASYIALC